MQRRAARWQAGREVSGPLGGVGGTHDTARPGWNSAWDEAAVVHRVRSLAVSCTLPCSNGMAHARRGHALSLERDAREDQRQERCGAPGGSHAAGRRAADLKWPAVRRGTARRQGGKRRRRRPHVALAGLRTLNRPGCSCYLPMQLQSA